MDPAHVTIPPMKDLTGENITQNTILVNSQSGDARLTYVFERLVSHLHDFARETRLSTNEWLAGLEFLTETGKICQEGRHEFILLSDILGLSLLVDSINHPKPACATESTLLGPYHSHEAEDLPHGDTIWHNTSGEPCLVLCSVRDSKGQPIENVKIDIWETDASGHYDSQRPDLEGHDGRCVMMSDAEGSFWFRGIKPVSYPICGEGGPVEELLKKLKRHPYRPAHIHFIFEKEGYDQLVTALYMRGDPYESSDAVFGVKDSLLVEVQPASDELAKKYDVKPGSKVLKYDFVLISEKEASDLREEKSRKALADLGRNVKLVEGLPVPDVD